MAICNDEVAMLAGVNAGIIAELMMRQMEQGEEVTVRFGREWCRCSFKTITVACPFLSYHQVEYAVGLLRSWGILVSKQLELSSFDHTNWYSFTEYGRKLMGRGDGDA